MELTPEQSERLKQIVARQLRFVNRLVARMQQLQFPVVHPLWTAGEEARRRVQDLLTAAHYAGIRSGVGRVQK